MAKVASAKRHAQALFLIAGESGEVEKWRAELRSIAATLADPQLASILENPKVRLSDKIQLIDKLLPDASQLARNFTYLLVAKQRLGILESIVGEYDRMADSAQGLEHARVTTAVPIDKDGEKGLSELLAQITGKKIVLTADVDPGIIGGFIARIGDRLIDGSTLARLSDLKKRLLETAH